MTLHYVRITDINHMFYDALSILKPSVDNIVSGVKNIEIRSWVPREIPLKNVVLVQNEKYLHHKDDIDSGIAMAIVDIIDVLPWTRDEYLKQGPDITIGKKWSPGYYMWVINNVRPLNKKIICDAKKGIYKVNINL